MIYIYGEYVVVVLGFCFIAKVTCKREWVLIGNEHVINILKHRDHSANLNGSSVNISTSVLIHTLEIIIF